MFIFAQILPKETPEIYQGLGYHHRSFSYLKTYKYITLCSALQIRAPTVLMLRMAGSKHGVSISSNGVMFTPLLVKIGNWFKV
jgi:hypothetical protein